ncbi:hypothetical protein PLICRDRAFT_173268 [Plicaturopsis crispa FD-325 SS-3]|nr:hypothetical protein PLICRDRAFT_173268 [Plicaturopsis crispa FD-325 SS-3]
MSLPTRKIGSADVSAIGYGAMGIAANYGSVEPDEQRLEFLDAVYAKGCTFWDTADAYADSEDLIGKWQVSPSSILRIGHSNIDLPLCRFKRSGKRSDIFLATKFGLRSSPTRLVNGDPEYVHKAIAKSLSRLGVDFVDLYYLHRADSTVPIEKTVGAMAELVKAGKVKYLGLSECSSKTLRRAHAVHPISAIQVEYSPFTLDIEDEKFALLKTARELGVTVVAYSPLGRGLLTGQYKSPDDFEEGDFRRRVPRYSKENFHSILELADGLKNIGAKHGATAGQVALAWLLAQGPDVIPIPGTRKIKYLDENLGAAQLKLTAQDIEEVRRIAEDADKVSQAYARYPPGLAETLFGDTPELV